MNQAAFSVNLRSSQGYNGFSPRPVVAGILTYGFRQSSRT
jgi:hypothetical protein